MDIFGRKHLCLSWIFYDLFAKTADVLFSAIIIAHSTRPSVETARKNCPPLKLDPVARVIWVHIRLKHVIFYAFTLLVPSFKCFEFFT